MSQVPLRDFMAVIIKLKDLREFCVRNNIDAWATRQALIIALEMDTAAALARGIRREDLESFDQVVKRDAREWMREHG